MSNRLPNVDSRNPKDVIINGFQMLLSDLEPLIVPIEISKEYPSQETFENFEDGTYKNVRRVVVKKLSNSINTPAIGNDYSGGFVHGLGVDENGRSIYQSVEKLGWVDQYVIEVSIWTSDLEDRDNLVELIKYWMLELEQRDIDDYGTKFFESRGIHAVTFMKAYEDTNWKLNINGPTYIGILTYSLIASFTGEVKELWERYKFILDGVITYPGTTTTVRPTTTTYPDGSPTTTVPVTTVKVSPTTTRPPIVIIDPNDTESPLPGTGVTTPDGCVDCP